MFQRFRSAWSREYSTSRPVPLARLIPGPPVSAADIGVDVPARLERRRNGPAEFAGRIGWMSLIDIPSIRSRSRITPPASIPGPEIRDLLAPEILDRSWMSVLTPGHPPPSRGLLALATIHHPAHRPAGARAEKAAMAVDAGVDRAR